jgi:glycosyltransferase involved in cell wall biosynthesis
MKPRVCILVFSQIAFDSRVLRQVEYARREFSVDVIAFGEWEPPEGVRYFQLPKTPRSKTWLVQYGAGLAAGRLFPKTYDRIFWLKKEYRAAVQLMERGNYDLIHANDWDALPVAVRAAEGSATKVLFDAHEYSPEQEGDRTLWRWLVKPYRIQLFKIYLPKVHGMTTVSDGLQELYEANWGIRPEVVMNARPYHAHPFRPVDPQHIHLVYHGYALRARYLEDYIRMLSYLPASYDLHMLAVAGDQAYLDELKALADRIVPGRVTFYGQMPSDQLVEWVSHFDVGLPSGRVKNLNTRYTLGNKFFDYVMAGLAVLVSPQRSYESLIASSGIGVVAASPEPQVMAQAVLSLTADALNNCKRASLELARTLNAEGEMGKLIAVYHRILQS